MNTASHGRFASAALSIVSVLLLTAAIGPGDLSAQVTVSGTSQLSQGLNGQTPLGTSGGPVLAPNGRFLAFRSDASNLIDNDVNGNLSDVFLRDLGTGSLSLISVNSSQVQGDDQSRSAAISQIGPDGWFAVAFQSQSSNLTLSNQNGLRNVFVRFPTRGLTVPVSFTTGVVSGDNDSDNPSVAITSAPNVAHIAFNSFAENLVTGDTNNSQDVFLSDVLDPASASQDPSEVVTTRIISRQSASVQANGDSFAPQISGDGNFVVFVSNATNLISGRTMNNSSQIYLYTVATGALTLLTQTSGGFEGDDNSTTPVISYSGRYVAFLTNAKNLLTGVSGNDTALLLLDRNTNTLTRMNTSSDGTVGNGSASDPSISPNGRFITFSDSSDNLIPGDTNQVDDVFVRDIETGIVSRSSNPISGDADGDSDTTCNAGTSYNSLTGNISFRSLASNLTTSPTGGGGDVFLAGAGYQTPTLFKGLKLETPADVTVVGKKVNISTQKFTLAVPSAGTIEARAAKKKKIKFDVRIEGTGAVKKERFRIISARNTVSKRNLKPGVYTARYRAVIETPTKTVPTTPFSPRQTFQAG